MLSSYLPDPFVRDDPRKEKESLQFLWVLVLVSTVSRHARSTQKDYIHILKGVWGEDGLGVLTVGARPEREREAPNTVPNC